MSALSRLPAAQAAALRLVYSDRMTQAEVAKKLGATVDEVKRLVASGLQTLSAQLSAT
jgi:DNA-directed RNA polymerase specialized sigma24 family protein